MAYRCVEGHGWCNGCNGGEPCGEPAEALEIAGYCSTCGGIILSGEGHFLLEDDCLHDEYQCLRGYFEPYYELGE